jgi:hypothetical protein
MTLSLKVTNRKGCFIYHLNINSFYKPSFSLLANFNLETIIFYNSKNSLAVDG